MPEFKPSFIPKRETSQQSAGQEKRGRTVGLLMLISLGIFFVSIIAWGGLFFYKALLDRQVASMVQSVERAKEAVEPALIERLKRLDERIDVSERLLSEHQVLTPLFNLLEESTLQSVRYSRFDYSLDADGNPQLQMEGEATGYTALALQSDVFGTSNLFEEPAFSNLQLNQRGNVIFVMTTPLAGNFLNYRDNLEIFLPEGGSEAESPSATTSPQTTAE